MTAPATSSPMRSILPKTFVHIPGVGMGTERNLWARGISTWSRFLGSQRDLPASLCSSEVRDLLAASQVALRESDANFFAAHLPKQYWWRLYPSFARKAVFLDIETTGLSRYYDEVTLVGLYNGHRVTTLLAGHNLETISTMLEPFELVVTFNGTSFDLPFLTQKFPRLRIPPIHLDLRYLLRRLGYAGGLKDIEGQLGLLRPRQLQGLDGSEAPVLWARYQRGILSALQTLVQYNAADVTVLRVLMEFAHKQLVLQLETARSMRVPRLIPSRSKRVLVRVAPSGTSDMAMTVNRTITRLPLPQPTPPAVTLTGLLERLPNPAKRPTIVGIDLRASSVRNSGWAVLRGCDTATSLLATDSQLIQETVRHEPDIISIDAPLTLPRGRCCVDDTCQCRRHGIVRECERVLWKRGIRVYPCLLPSMQKLTQRGMMLAERFRSLGFTVIESYPGAAQDIMRIPRKKTSIEDLRYGLEAFGIRGTSSFGSVTHDELDAVTSAVVGYFHLTGDIEALGNNEEGFLIVPKLYPSTRT